MMLTLGQAAKQVGKSKPTLSEAIKKGRLSASKNEAGHFQIDPAELFRVYPKPSQPNGLGEADTLSSPNPSKSNGFKVESKTFTLLLAERDKLIAEKDKRIQRLEQEIENIRDDFQNERKRADQNIQLLENKSAEQGLKKTVSLLEEKNQTLQKQISNLEDKLSRRITTYRNKIEQILVDFREQGVDLDSLQNRYQSISQISLDLHFEALDTLQKQHLSLYREIYKRKKAVFKKQTSSKNKWFTFRKIKNS